MPVHGKTQSNAVVVLASILLLAVCAFGQNVSPPSESTSASDTGSRRSTPSDSSLRLGVGDLLDMTVYNVPELSTKSRVSDNGDLYLPLIDHVHVAGLSVEEAQEVVERRLSQGGFVNDPHVQLLVEEFASQGVSVLGEVQHPGVYHGLGQQRLLDFISMAGGFTDKAGRMITVTHRDKPESPAVITLQRDPGDDPATNVAILGGDTILVRRADLVYVVGDVGKPSGFLMDSGSLTVLQAIALAGGTNRTAKLSGARIIRKGPQGMAESPVELKKILEARAPDTQLQPDDILFVPTSTGKVAAARSLEAVFQAATALSIVAVRP